MSETPKVGISIVLVDKEKQVLMGKRKGSHGNGLWSLPGGHVEVGESLEDACRRELLEETGLTIKEGRTKLKLFHLSEDFFPDNKHYITLYYYVHINNTTGELENKEPEKCSGWKWFTTIKWNWSNKKPNLPDEDQVFCNSIKAINKIIFSNGLQSIN